MEVALWWLIPVTTAPPLPFPPPPLPIPHPRVLEAGAGRLTLVQGLPGLHREVQDTLGYLGRTCHKQTNKRGTRQNFKRVKDPHRPSLSSGLCHNFRTHLEKMPALGHCLMRSLINTNVKKENKTSFSMKLKSLPLSNIVFVKHVQLTIKRLLQIN